MNARAPYTFSTCSSILNSFTVSWLLMITFRRRTPRLSRPFIHYFTITKLFLRRTTDTFEVEKRFKIPPRQTRNSRSIDSDDEILNVIITITTYAPKINTYFVVCLITRLTSVSFRSKRQSRSLAAERLELSDQGL